VMGLVKLNLRQLQMMQYKFVFPDGTSSNAPSGILNKLLQKLVLILYCNRLPGTGECRRIVLLVQSILRMLKLLGFNRWYC
jgi:hypothetical protein